MKTKLLPLIFSLFALSAFSQTPEARLFDRFESVTCDDYLARMDAVIVEQNNDPGAQIFVLVYEGKETRAVYEKGKFTDFKSSAPPRGLAKARIESMRKYIKSRRQTIDSYVFADGGARENFAVEIWVVPAGAEAPKPTPALEKITYRKGKPQGFCLECCGP